MAVTKEAITIVLDVGKSMHNDNGCPTVLDEAKKCINMIIQRKIFSESKDEIALILFGSWATSDSVANEIYDSDYTNIHLVQQLQPASWEILEFVEGIQGTEILTDFMRDTALLMAINLLQRTIECKKYLSRRILFISCFDGFIHSDRVDKICEDLKTYKIDLNVIGPVAFPYEDIRNGSYMESYEGERILPNKEETSITKILNEVNGESYSFSEVLPALIYYQKKKLQPFPWNASLDVGTNLTIPISAYIKVDENKPKAWKCAYAHKINAKLEKGVTYFINENPNDILLETKVSKEGIIPAYKYGTTLVAYSEEDKINMEYQSGEKGMKVLGFTKIENVQRYHYIGDKSMYVFGQKNRELAGVILAPFIQALYDTKMVAIVRYVYSQRSAPKIGFLYPRIKPNYECLVFVALPFMEDLSHFVFTPLDSDLQNIPTEDQLSAVDDLITAMDLSCLTNEEEIFKPKNMVNPYLQRLYQCLQFKAFHPDGFLPEIEPHIQALVNPVPELLKRAETSLKRIKSLFPIKETSKLYDTDQKIFSKSQSELIEREYESLVYMPKSTYILPEKMTVNAMTEEIKKVGTINPVTDFQYLVSNQVLPFENICQQMMDVVVKFLQDSTHLRLHHSKIISICKEFRRASLKEGDPVKYNSFMFNLQNVLLECDEELWDKIRNEKINLISKKEVPSSSVSPEQADMFLLSPSSPEDNLPIQPVVCYEENESDYNNLLEEL